MVNNLTNLTSAENLYDIVVFTNQVTGGFMGMGFIIIFFIILLGLFMKKYEFAEAALVSTFICFGLSMMLVSIELLNFWFLVMFIILMAFSGFWVTLSKR